MAARKEATMICVDYHIEHGYTLCLAPDGSVTSFGRSLQKGHGQRECEVYPPKKLTTVCLISSISCGAGHTVCLDFSGNVFSFGANKMKQLGTKKKATFTAIPQKMNVPPIKQISTGNYFTICLARDGKILEQIHHFYKSIIQVMIYQILIFQILILLHLVEIMQYLKPLKMNVLFGEIMMKVNVEYLMLVIILKNV